MKSIVCFGVAAVFGMLAGCEYKPTPDPVLSAHDQQLMALAPKGMTERAFERYQVDDPTGERPGTIVVDTKEHYLYYVLANKKAIRYGVATGADAYGWTGTAVIKAKKEWPSWLPPADMVQRWPNLKPVIDMGGLPGGPENPLGARALYLFDTSGHDTLYRIHGTNEPEEIGHPVSSGCIRMRNIDAIDLYNRAPLGTKVIVQ